MLAHESSEIAHHNVKCKASNSTYPLSHRAPKNIPTTQVLLDEDQCPRVIETRSVDGHHIQLMVEPFHHLVIRSEGFCTLVGEEWSCAHRHRRYLEQTYTNDEAGRNIRQVSNVKIRSIQPLFPHRHVPQPPMYHRRRPPQEQVTSITAQFQPLGR
jgi:hypothetical protein